MELLYSILELDILLFLFECNEIEENCATFGVGESIGRWIDTKTYVVSLSLFFPFSLFNYVDGICSPISKWWLLNNDGRIINNTNLYTLVRTPTSTTLPYTCPTQPFLPYQTILYLLLYKLIRDIEFTFLFFIQNFQIFSLFIL